MATFVKLDNMRINLDNVTYINADLETARMIREGREVRPNQKTVAVHLINEPTVYLPWEEGGELLLKVVDVRALGTHVKPVAEGE